MHVNVMFITCMYFNIYVFSGVFMYWFGGQKMVNSLSNSVQVDVKMSAFLYFEC